MSPPLPSAVFLLREVEDIVLANSIRRQPEATAFFWLRPEAALSIGVDRVSSFFR